MDKQKIQTGDIVTVDLKNASASNTFILSHYIDENTALLTHPLFPECYVKYDVSQLNLVPANIKDYSERSLDFVKAHGRYLGFIEYTEFECLALYYSVRRKLTPKQKATLSTLCGRIASIKLNEDVKEAMRIIVKNEALLDEYNHMWYSKFWKVFSGKQSITSKNQRDVIFNIAGFVLAELENPSASK